MFRLSSTQPCKIQGVIIVKQPIQSLGYHTDIHGIIWDIHAIYGTNDGIIVNAVPQCELHPYFKETTSDSYGFVSQTWKPYKVEVSNLPD